jgi:voltage-gated potassium channel
MIRGEDPDQPGGQHRPVSIFFGTDRGMVSFLAFLVLTTFVVPIFTLSQLGRIAVSLSFLLTLTFGALATIQDRFLKFLVVAITVSALATDLIAEFEPAYASFEIATTLKLVCLSILVVMTLKRTFRPGPVNVYRVIGGIAGYLLIGYVWTLAYRLLIHEYPAAIHFASSTTDPLHQPAALLYFSFATLTTVGYGDTYPVHPAVRSLAVAEALVGQLYLAILIASLVGMALQSRSAIEREEERRVEEII